MTTTKKVLLLVLCAALLVGASVAGTVAYLTSQDTVTNTFTVGKVGITLKEYDVDPQTGLKKSPLAEVEKLEKLELVPGREIQKHPFVTVVAESEPCWLFVKVENGLKTFEASGETTIANQMEKNGWVELKGVDNVYYYRDIVATSTSAQVFDLFTSVKIADNADSVASWSTIETNGNIVINAYAIQSEGFNTKSTAAENADDAWGDLNPATT